MLINSSMWEELNDYELRNILHHLLYAREVKAYEIVLLQADFLEEFIIRNGMGLLLDTLGGTVPLCSGHRGPLTNTKNLLQVLTREAGSLDGWKRNEKKHSFFDQVSCSAILFDTPLALSKERLAKEKIKFRVRWKELRMDETVRMLMPGKRRSVGWDIYDAGWMLPQTSIQIDIDKNLLQTQTCCTYSYGFGDYEETYYRRDYSLLNCILLKEYPSVVVNKAYPNKERGPSEILFPKNSGYVIPHSKKLELKLRKHLVAMGLDRKAELHINVLAASSNTDHLLVAISTKDPSSNRYTQESFYHLYDITADRLVLSTVSQQLSLQSSSTKQMVSLNQQLYLFYTDTNDDLIRIEVSALNDHYKVVDRVTSSDTDPVGRNLLLVHSGKVEVRAVWDGSVVWQIPLPEHVSSFDIYSLLCKKGSQCAICIGKVLNRYFLPGDYSEAVEIESSNKDLVLSRDLAYYVTGRQVYKPGSPTALATFALDMEVAPFYKSSIGYISHNNNLYIEKSDYLICVWNFKTGKSIASFCSQLNHWEDSGHLVGFDLSPDERFIISANNGHEIIVWDLWNMNREAPYPHWRLNGLDFMRDIQIVQFSNGGYWVLVVTQDQQLYVCSFESDTKVLGSIRLHQMPQDVHAPAFSKTVMAVFSDGSLICYEISELIAGTRVQEDGVLFCLNDATASSVEIAGSFNDWQRLPLIKVDNGWWQCRLQLEKGRYEYKYVVNGSTWKLDPVMPSLPTPFGFNSYVDV